MDFNLYNIEPQEFRQIDRHEVNDDITYELEPVKELDICPTCGFKDIMKYGKFDRNVRDLSEHAKRVGLIIHSHRYRCRNCGGTFTPTYESVDSKSRMTNRMRDYIRKQALKVPFSHISDELSVSVPTVKGIFKDYVAELDSKHQIVAPKILGMDENYLNRQYRCVFTDIENGLIIDMMTERTLSSVKDWISRLPEKNRIECVTIDMWGPYKDAAKTEIPGIPIVIDKFHVIKNLNEALDKIRKSENDKLSTKNRVLLKNNRWLMLRNKEDLSDSDRVRLDMIFASYPQFEEPYKLKESFRDIYKADTREKAEKLYSDWKSKAELYPMFEDFIDSVDRWHTEIFNYFDFGCTNAVTEALNGVCKSIAAVGRGYTFDVLRAKILYGTKASKPAKFKYYKEAETSKLPTGTYRFMTHIGAKQKQRIEVSSGTDIRLMAYYLKTQKLWDMEP